MFEQEVQRGVALLDAKAPLWRDQIDTGTLDLSSGTQCVLGQVFGGYFTGLAVLEIREGAEAQVHGFYLPTEHEEDDEDEYEVDPDYEPLTEAWLDYLNA